MQEAKKILPLLQSFNQVSGGVHGAADLDRIGALFSRQRYLTRHVSATGADNSATGNLPRLFASGLSLKSRLVKFSSLSLEIAQL